MSGLVICSELTIDPVPLVSKEQVTCCCYLCIRSDGKAFGLQKVDELAEIAMTAAHQQGQHEKAIEAARLIR